MKTLFISTKDGKGAGAAWRGPVRGCELEEGRLEVDGRLRRVFRLLEPWGELPAGDVVEVLLVPDDVDPRQLLELEGVTRIMSAAAAAKIADKLPTWTERSVPAIAGGSIPLALEGAGAGAVVAAEKVDGQVLEKTAGELGVDVPDDVAGVEDLEVPK